MRSFTAAGLVAAVLASQVSATIYTTNPVASTTCTAGTACTVAWNDDGTTPALGTIGPCSIDLCTGGQQQQTCLQNVSPSTDVSQIATVSFLPNANIGQNGAYYFIKYTALNYMDPANPTFHFTAYSAKFTLAGMTGTFNSTVLGEISGAVVAPAATTTTGPAATPSFLATSKVVTVTSKATTAAAATTSAKKSGAAAMTVPGVVSGVTGVTVAMGFASAFLGMIAFGL